MLSAGVRLLLVVVAPVLGALLVHELRHHRSLAQVVAVVAIAVCGGLTASVISGVAGGGTVEHSFGSALPGIDLTARADSASVVAVTVACLAALLSFTRHRQDAERLCGLLLCLAGTAIVATAGNLVLVASGVEVVAAGTLLLRGRRGPGLRSAAVLAGLLGASGLALIAAAAQLVAGAGSSDLAFIPQGAVGGAVAVPWALAGVGLLTSPALPTDSAPPRRDWAAVGAMPSGFLVLLRLQQSAGGQLPGNAAVTLALIGAVVACLAAISALRAVTLAAAGRAAVAVLSGVLVSLFGGSLTADGTVLAGLFVALELALVAAPSWDRRPSAWSAASVGLFALPGGATFAVLVVGLGVVAQRGAGGFAQLLALTAAVVAAVVAVVRAVTVPPRGFRPAPAGAVVAVAAGLAGGLLPGLALRYVAAPLAGGAAAVDIDAGALQLPGGGFAGGYFAVAAAILLVTVAAAMVLAGEETVAAAAPPPRPIRLPRIAPLLSARRRTATATRRLGGGLRTLDRWLEAQPQLPLLLGAAALAVLLFR